MTNPLDDLNALKSGDIAKQSDALDNLKNFFLIAIQESLTLLRVTDHPLLVAEKVFCFGSMALPVLQKLFLEVDESPLKVIIASLLVQLGSSTGTETLVTVIKNGGEHELLALTSLCKANIRDCCPVIVERLEKMNKDFYTKRRNAPFVNAFLDCLEKLNCPLPPNLKQKFTAPDVPPDISKFIE